MSDAWPSRGSWDSESSAAGYTPGASLDSGQSGDSWASGDSEPRDADAAPWSPLDPGSSGGSRGAALGPDAWLPQESAPGSAQDSDSVGDSWGSQGSLSGSDSWSPLDSAPSRGSDSLESDRAPWSSSDSGDSWDSEAPASGSSSWGPRPSGSGEGSWDSDSPLDGDAPFPSVSGPGSASDSWSSRTPDSSLDGDAPFPTVSGPGSASDAWASQGSDPLQDTWRQTRPGEELWKSDREQSSEWRGTGGLDSWSPSEDTGDTWKASGTTEPWTEQAERPWSDQTRNPSYSGDRYDDELSPRPAEGARPTDRYDDELSPPAGGTGNTWAFDRDDPRLPDVVRDAERRRRETPRDEYGDWGEDDEPDTGTLSAAVPSSEDPLAAIADMQSRARTKDHEDDPELDRDEEGDDSWRGGEGATQMFSAPSFDEDPSLGRDGPEDRYEDDPSDEDDRDRGEVETDYEDDFTPADYGMPERPKPAKRRRDKIAEDFPGFDEARDDGDYPGYDSIDFLADTEPGANVTLWLGLASVIPGLGVITAILALFVTGPKAKRAIRESRGTLDGLGLITTGTVFAVIGILVTVISVAIWFVL
ncbi:hypothetical protein [Nocardiopsis sp. L17-MgMaSL7]|uniref:hypothetical protein n=1 Tax=Nocardiopsis sp. L17-MgMaSL7 TaxID=1938893 RepID=UPI0011B46F03|nr:hypothetical protein [Nocardiopsis sp. L17-MgMaSL7]